MNMNGILAGLVAALKAPSLAWNILKHGGLEADKRSDEDIKAFIDNIKELKKNLEDICKNDPTFNLCEKYFSGYYDKYLPTEPKLDKTMVGKTIPKKDLKKNTVDVKWTKIK